MDSEGAKTTPFHRSSFSTLLIYSNSRWSLNHPFKTNTERGGEEQKPLRENQYSSTVKFLCELWLIMLLLFFFFFLLPPLLLWELGNRHGEKEKERKVNPRCWEACSLSSGFCFLVVLCGVVGFSISHSNLWFAVFHVILFIGSITFVEHPPFLISKCYKKNIILIIHIFFFWCSLIISSSLIVKIVIFVKISYN